jgi:hypothetical protein
MEDFTKEKNQRQAVFDFINNKIEFEAKMLYTKKYNVDFLFRDFLNDQIPNVVEHFKGQIDENRVIKFSKELVGNSDDNIVSNTLYLNQNSLDSLIKG